MDQFIASVGLCCYQVCCCCCCLFCCCSQFLFIVSCESSIISGRRHAQKLQFCKLHTVYGCQPSRFCQKFP